jgi:hypothetical protein
MPRSHSGTQPPLPPEASAPPSVVVSPAAPAPPSPAPALSGVEGPFVVVPPLLEAPTAAPVPALAPPGPAPLRLPDAAPDAAPDEAPASLCAGGVRVHPTPATNSKPRSLTRRSLMGGILQGSARFRVRIAFTPAHLVLHRASTAPCAARGSRLATRDWGRGFERACGPLFASALAMHGSNGTPRPRRHESQGWRRPGATTFADAALPSVPLALLNTPNDLRPQIEQFASFGVAPWSQRRRPRMSKPGDRSCRLSTFARCRSTQGALGTAFKNETSPQNAPLLTDRARSQIRRLVHDGGDGEQGDAGEQSDAGDAGDAGEERSRQRSRLRPTRLRPTRLRPTRQHAQSSLSKLVATTNYYLQDSGSRQQRDAERQSKRDPRRSGAGSARSTIQAQFKPIYESGCVPTGR